MIFAIGDIHGNFSGLQNLLSKVDLDLKTDHLVLLGDLVDSGPETRDVIEWAIKKKAEFPDTFHPLKGNHEDLLLDAVLARRFYRDNPELWLEQGGQGSIASYGGNLVNWQTVFPKEHLEWLDALPHYWETEDYFFVHGGVRNIPLAEHDFTDLATLKDLFWLRESFISSKFNWEKKIIYGHTPPPNFQPLFKKNKIGINTQPRYNIGKLCGVILPEERIVWDD